MGTPADDSIAIAVLEAEGADLDRLHALRGFARLNGLAERFYLDLEYDARLRAPFLSAMGYLQECEARLREERANG